MDPDAKLAGTGTVGADVRPWWSKSSRGYDIFGPDKDGEISLEFDTETTIVWLTREDVERMLAHWPNSVICATKPDDRKEGER